MKIRKRNLPEGWYPNSPKNVENLIKSWVPAVKHGSTRAGIVPHAGWTYCGKMIAEVLATLPSDLECIVVLGGHNPPGGPFVVYAEESWDLPSGILKSHQDLIESVGIRMKDSMKPVGELAVDNTVEVLMPMIAAMHPAVRWAAWRVPADERALTFGRILFEAAEESGGRTAVIGSTDLTHYGPDFRFTPGDSLPDPVTWMEIRDRSFLDAIATFQGSAALDMADSGKTACSAGGAAAAMAYALESGCGPGKVLSYSTSRDVHPASSWVGYGTVIWETP